MWTPVPGRESLPPVGCRRSHLPAASRWQRRQRSRSSRSCFRAFGRECPWLNASDSQSESAWQKEEEQGQKEARSRARQTLACWRLPSGSRVDSPVLRITPLFGLKRSVSGISRGTSDGAVVKMISSGFIANKKRERRKV